MGFTAHQPKKCHFGILIIFELKLLKQQQVQGYPDPPLTPWGGEINSHCEGYTPYTWGVKGIFTARDQKFKAEKAV